MDFHKEELAEENTLQLHTKKEPLNEDNQRFDAIRNERANSFSCRRNTAQF